MIEFNFEITCQYEKNEPKTVSCLKQAIFYSFQLSHLRSLKSAKSMIKRRFNFKKI